MTLSKLQTEYTFAGFNFPRYIVQIPRGLKPNQQQTNKEILRTRASRACGPYYSSPGTAPAEQASFYLGSDFAPALRIEWADEVVRSIRHKGWYCDEYQDQTIRGIVARLPHGRGFLAGWSMGKGMSSSLDRATIYDSEDEAARAADEEARIAAERQREYEELENLRISAEEADEQEADEDDSERLGAL